MSLTTRIARNIASGWIGYATNAIVTLLLTPFVLESLGPTRYGIWAIAASVVGYYGLLDMGMRGGINQFLTRYITVRNFKAASGCLSTALAVLSGIGALCGLLSLAAGFLAPRWLDIPAEAVTEAFWCILIIGVSSALQLVLFPYMALFMATHRFDLANGIGVLTRILSGVLVYAALRAGYGLIGVSLAMCATNILDYILRWQVGRRLVPQVRASRHEVSRERLHEMSRFGAWSFLQALNAFLQRHGQPVLIGSMLPIAAVGYHALATGLLQQIVGVLAPVGQVLYPVAAGMHAQGNREALVRLYHDGSRLMLLLMVSVVLITAFWAPDFYRLWIGPQYLGGGDYPSVALLLQVLLISVVANYVSNIGGQILLGAGHVRTYALALTWGSALNVGVLVVLVPFIGLMGAVIATVTASAVVDLVLIPVLVQRKLRLRITDFVRASCGRPLAVGAILAIVLAVFRAEIPAPNSWPALALHVTLAVGVAGVLTLTLGVTREERQRLLIAASAAPGQRREELSTR